MTAVSDIYLFCCIKQGFFVVHRALLVYTTGLFCRILQGSFGSGHDLLYEDGTKVAQSSALLTKEIDTWVFGLMTQGSFGVCYRALLS